MSRIRHVALMTKDTHKLAEFYKLTFGLHEVMRRDKPNGAVYLSDGHINVAILPNEGPEADGSPDGIHHFGFHVDDVESAAQTAMEHGATQGRSGVPVDGRFAEAYIKDPAGQRIDLSKAGWKV
jgi:catechol 2,3-dioxygenase-like lactoylglutathione lyase family enzyme